MIVNSHDRSNVEARVKATSSVGYDESTDPEQCEDARGEDAGRGGVSFVRVEPTETRDNGDGGEVAEGERGGVTRDGGFGETRDRGVGDVNDGG